MKPETSCFHTLAEEEAFGALPLALPRLCVTMTVGEPGPLAAASDATLALFSEIS